jgi:hypothetical protein
MTNSPLPYFGIYGELWKSCKIMETTGKKKKAARLHPPSFSLY